MCTGEPGCRCGLLDTADSDECLIVLVLNGFAHCQDRHKAGVRAPRTTHHSSLVLSRTKFSIIFILCNTLNANESHYELYWRLSLIYKSTVVISLRSHSNPTVWPKSEGYSMGSQLSPRSIIWGVIVELENKYGWTNEELRGFVGENA